MQIKDLLKELDELKLPKDQYVIYGSGPLAVRELRQTDDLDVVVSDDLFGKIKNNFKVIHRTPTKEIREIYYIQTGNIELIPASCSLIKDLESCFKNADIFHNHPFVNLEDLVCWKKTMGREKDFRDIELIKNYLNKKEE